jgi:hypothetical protein
LFFVISGFVIALLAFARLQRVAAVASKRAWRTVAWREGTNVKLRSRFVCVRAAPIPGEGRFDEETLLIEWPLCRMRGHYAARQTMPSELVFPSIHADRQLIGSA